MPADLTGVVLAGGASRRMGRSKDAIELSDGRTMLHAALALMRAITDDVLIAGAPSIEIASDVPIVADDTPGAGPLAAVASVLRSGAAARYLVIPCDMPRLTGPRLRTLADIEARLAAYRTRERLHPLPLLVHASMLARIDALLADGVRSLHRLLDDPAARIVEVDDDSGFANVNTPDDLSRLG